MSTFTCHLKIRVKGPAPKVVMFHNMMHHIDADWPFIDPGGSSSPVKRRVCAKCGGRVYRAPRLSPADLKLAGKECGVKVRVDRFAHEVKCFPVGATEVYDVIPGGKGA